MSMCDLPSVYRHSERTARKQHRCCECSAPILIGEKHFYCFGVWNGKSDTYRQHLDCMNACILIRDAFNDGECIGFGTLFDQWDEMRWQYSRASQSDRESWGELRGLLAKILRRERRSP